MSETSWLRRLFIGRTEQVVNEVRDLATAEMEASGLPGRQGGPADAYRHMLAAAELTRRLGPLEAYAILEYNEMRSERAGENQRGRGARVPPANQPEFIGMDRHNNTMAIGVGARAWTFDDIVEGVRGAFDRAGSDGSGFAGRPTWLQEEKWDDGRPVHRPNWPNPDWTTVPRSERREQYRFDGPLHRNRSQDVRSTGIGPMLADPETGDLGDW